MDIQRIQTSLTPGQALASQLTSIPSAPLNSWRTPNVLIWEGEGPYLERVGVVHLALKEEVIDGLQLSP